MVKIFLREKNKQLMAYTMRSGLSGLAKLYNVSLPVGLNMPNQRDDVLLVQTLIKLANFDRIHPGHGPVEASRNIKVDGWFGPQTARMIKAFEENRKGQKLLLIDDGIVESSTKDGFTGKGVLYKIVHLNRMAKEQGGWQHDHLPGLPDTHPILRKALAKGTAS